MSQLERYADKSMYEAAPMEAKEPQVHLLWMTEDPLGAIAAACRMYEGKPTYRLSDITDDERWHYAEQVQKTHLKAPLEFVKFHFFVEGVDRAFTHQMVRQRTAVFAQESLRFAVKDNFAEEVLVPPSIEKNPDVLGRFDDLMNDIQAAYDYMVANNIPAEDARSILPHCTTTRMNYCTDLRNLADHSGNRLCTQAQFIWRRVFLQILKSIHDYSQAGADLVSLNLFKPVCYQLGHCPFTADFDRGCTIRERVELNAKSGISSDMWNTPHRSEYAPSGEIPAIRIEEWMEDEQAAWVR